MLDTIGTITSVALSIGGVVVALTTQLNHVAHIKADVDRHAAEIKDLYIKLDGVYESIGKLHAETETNHAELMGEIKGMKGICDERHK